MLFTVLLTGCVSLANNWLEHEGTYLVAHRGAHIIAPENTVESIHQAKILGYQAVEIDVRTSRDGVNFLMHDDTLDRTTDGTGKPETYTIKQLKKFNLDTKNYPEYVNKKVKIPTFEEAVKEIKKNNLIVNVDGSKGNWQDEHFVNDIVNTLKQNSVYERSFFVLTDKKIRDEVVKNYPDCTVSWLYDQKNKLEDEIEQVKSYKKALLSVSNDAATEETINKLNKSGIEYQVYGVNDVKRFEVLKKSSVPIVETDEINPSDL
ncbi:glycerophosphodiester phosphodiesterase [Enterococcus lactis]|uniref:glycerophosphodiester phosphodiesterase n=1 Tax=Enterococcus lactis TaxID=357441 RepID=UPI001CDB6376|nr:glycerophosphodiester phosphodiesterase family protein [Enterococcus lactis]UBX38307.1 glycerophosphodiester phosphodiesterase family protein [Enterococcus lactis]